MLFYLIATCSVFANLLTFAILAHYLDFLTLPEILCFRVERIFGKKKERGEYDDEDTAMTPYRKGEIYRGGSPSKKTDKFIIEEGLNLLKTIWEYFLDTEEDEFQDPKTILSFITKAFNKSSQQLKDELEIKPLRRSARLHNSTGGANNYREQLEEPAAGGGKPKNNIIPSRSPTPFIKTEQHTDKKRRLDDEEKKEDSEDEEEIPNPMRNLRHVQTKEKPKPKKQIPLEEILARRQPSIR